MTAIVCEMCSSNDIIKQDGLYTCQNCGTKYSAEDARALMQGSVEIKGEVSVGNIREMARENALAVHELQEERERAQSLRNEVEQAIQENEERTNQERIQVHQEKMKNQWRLIKSISFVAWVILTVVVAFFFFGFPLDFGGLILAGIIVGVLVFLVMFIVNIFR